MSTTTVLFRTTFTRTIKLNLLLKYFTVLFLSSRNSSVSLPSINGQSGSENSISSSSSKRPSSDGKRKTTASSKQKINRVSEFLFKSHVIKSPYTVVIIVIKSSKLITPRLN